MTPEIAHCFQLLGPTSFSNIKVDMAGTNDLINIAQKGFHQLQRWLSCFVLILQALKNRHPLIWDATIDQCQMRCDLLKAYILSQGPMDDVTC
jgi:hypothetical protein